MAALIDYLGAIAIGGLIMIMVLGLYLTIGETAAFARMDAVVQENLTSVTDVLEYDFRKIGYRVVDSLKVTCADTSTIVFKTDINDDGTQDIIQYYLGAPKSPNSLNPNVHVLYRKVNNGADQSVDNGITRFRLNYYDALGHPTSVLSKIRSINIAIVTEGTTSFDTTFSGACWERTIKPQNLR